MFELKENFSLLKYNTFHIEASARYFVSVTSEEDIFQLLDSKLPEKSKYAILGGGSNLLLLDDYDGLLIHPIIRGIELKQISDTEYWITVGAGEIWDQLVSFTVDKELAGLENLSLIPGTVGASPVQNIGAYGSEVKDSLIHVEGIHLDSGKKQIFKNQDCAFSYRESIFKTKLKNRFLITHVTFRVSSHWKPLLNYGNLNDYIKRIGETTLQNVREAVIQIRSSKLPDPEKIGNAGSFFKNPAIPYSKALEIASKYPDVPIYPFNDSHRKIAAGWLIEKCGFKGIKNKSGRVGVHPEQALVIVNYGNANGNEILALANEITKTVFDKFGISLEIEVNILQ